MLKGVPGAEASVKGERWPLEIPGRKVRAPMAEFKSAITEPGEG